MEYAWKPKAWLSIFYGVIIQPFTFLYVNRARLFAVYLLLAFCTILFDIKLQAISDQQAWYHGIYFSWLFWIACPLHAYIICRTYNKEQKRQWYANWWTALICYTVFFISLALTRAFIVEPYSVPAASMSPTLNPTEQLVVYKWGYGNYRYLGLQLAKTAPSKKLSRGDIVVFQYPENPEIDYVKRVIGLPGDTIVYRDKTIFVKPACDDAPDNCENFIQVEREFKFADSDAGVTHEYYQEFMDDTSYDIKLNITRKDFIDRYFRQIGTQADEWRVPEQHYFVLGDNRDNSRDSRYWGFVPEANVIGTVVYVW